MNNQNEKIQELKNILTNIHIGKEALGYEDKKINKYYDVSIEDEFTSFQQRLDVVLSKIDLSLVTFIHRRIIKNKNNNYSEYTFFNKSQNNHILSCLQKFMNIQKRFDFIKKKFNNDSLSQQLDETFQGLSIFFERIVEHYMKDIQQKINFQNGQLFYNKTPIQNIESFHKMFNQIIVSLKNVYNQFWNIYDKNNLFVNSYENNNFSELSESINIYNTSQVNEEIKREKNILSKILKEAFFLREESPSYIKIMSIFENPQNNIENIQKNNSNIRNVSKNQKQNERDILLQKIDIRVQYVISKENQGNKTSVIVTYKGKNGEVVLNSNNSKKEEMIDSFLHLLRSMNEELLSIQKIVSGMNNNRTIVSQMNNDRTTELYNLDLDEIAEEYKKTKRILTELGLIEGNESYDKFIDLYSVFNIFVEKPNYNPFNKETVDEFISINSIERISNNIEIHPEEHRIIYKTIPLDSVTMKDANKIQEKNRKEYIDTDMRLFRFLHNVYERLRAFLQKHTNEQNISWNKTKNTIQHLFQQQTIRNENKFIREKNQLYGKYKKALLSLIQSLRTQEHTSKKNQESLTKIKEKINEIIHSKIREEKQNAL
jgi:hypothetical protein